MSPKKVYRLLRFYRFLEKTGIFFSTVKTRLRYWHLIETGRHCHFGHGVIIKTPWHYNGQPLVKLKMDDRASIGNYTLIQGDGHVSFGRNSYCGRFCIIGVNESVQIGDNVMIADCVTIRDTDHVFSDTSIPIQKQGMKTSPVRIEDDVWIGHGVSILKGVTVGRGAIVGAGAVVIKDVPPMAIVGGVPAKMLRMRV